MTSSRFRKVGFAAAAVVLSTMVAAVVAVEAVGWKARHYRDDQAIEARSARYSDREDRLRLLFVGDSFTAGSLSESNLGWWAYVPDALRDLGHQPRVEVLSVALAGSPTPFHQRQFEAFLDESGRTPDVVMIISGANNPNSQELWTAYTLSDVGRTHTTSAERAMYGAPTGLRLLALRLGRALGRDLPPDPRRRDVARLDQYLSEHPEYRAWLEAETTRRLTAFFATARDHGVRPLAGSYLSDPLIGATRTAAAQADVPFFDMESQELEQTWRADGGMASDGWHLSDDGNRRFAKRWAAWFVAVERP